MTTRKHTLGIALCTAALALGGCATPGPLHVYLSEAPNPAVVVDLGGAQPVDVPSYLEPEDKLTGMAYDPFTDHLFLRLAPGNKIRVVDRPARAVKREFTIEGLATADGGGGDLAVRPRDGHIFLLEPGATVAETTRLGKLVRIFSLVEAKGPLGGIAVDAAANRLAVLHADGRKITFHGLDGQRMGELTLERRVGPSLAIDGEHHELYAPLREGKRGVAVFDFNGKLVRTLPTAGAFVDVGPRSLVRVF
jgi:hypothetical protein